MNFRAILGLAFSYLWQRKLRSFLTILGVVIGVGALTLLVGFGLGLKKNIEGQMEFDDLMSIIIVYAPQESTVDIGGPSSEEPKTPLDQATLRKIRELPGVAEAQPDVVFRGQLRLGANRDTGMVIGMPPYANKKPVKDLLQAGDLFSADDANEILISEFLHTTLLKDSGMVSLLGKTITLEFTRDAQYAPVDDNGDPQLTGSVDVKVVGVLADTGHEKKRLGLYLVSSRMAIIPAGMAARLWDVEAVQGGSQMMIGPAVSRTYERILVRVENPQIADRTKKGLEDLKLDYLYVPDALAGQKFILWLFTIILGVIGGISLVVASIGIINTLVMSILERTREIGIMRAIGASNGEIMQMVMLEGIAIGLFGGLIGFGFSWVVGSIISALLGEGLANASGEGASVFYFPAWFFWGTIGFATFIAWLSSIYPAWRATRVDPVTALRRE